jgi:hypothetical protein
MNACYQSDCNSRFLGMTNVKVIIVVSSMIMLHRNESCYQSIHHQLLHDDECLPSVGTPAFVMPKASGVAL